MVRLGLIGWPLGHSFSARYFKDKFELEGIDGEYRTYPLKDISEFPELLNRNEGLCGLNVTIPHKQTVLRYLDYLSEDARAIGAVNVIRISYDRKGNRILGGYNTDWLGFRQSLLPLLDNHISSALVLGTGGASKAVAYALKSIGIEPRFVSRNPGHHAEATISYDKVTDSVIRENTLIINTTPLGMYPDILSAPPIPYEALTDRHMCYDLVYNPEETEFMKRCQKAGATVKNGLEMLHRQAELAWEIWSNEPAIP